MFKSIFLPLIAVAAFICVVGLLSQGKLDFIIKGLIPVEQTSQKSIMIGSNKIQVEVAKTNEEKAKGLSNRNSLDENSGMIFVFNKDSKPVFWMKDTKIALDLVWVNDNKIVEINKNIQPEIGKKDSELKKYSTSSNVDYVLEVNGGFCDKKGIKVGQSLSDLEQL